MIDIVFMEEFTGVNETYITDYDGLRQLGDDKMTSLITALQSGQGAPGTGQSTTGESCGSNTSTAIPSILVFIVTLIMLI
jgi:hypothetical protein